MAGLLALFPAPRILIAAITASELLHGVERAEQPDRRVRRQRHVELVLATLNVGEFQRVPGLRVLDATPFSRP